MNIKIEERNEFMFNANDGDENFYTLMKSAGPRPDVSPVSYWYDSHAKAEKEQYVASDAP